MRCPLHQPLPGRRRHRRRWSADRPPFRHTPAPPGEARPRRAAGRGTPAHESECRRSRLVRDRQNGLEPKVHRHSFNWGHSRTLAPWRRRDMPSGAPPQRRRAKRVAQRNGSARFRTPRVPSGSVRASYLAGPAFGKHGLRWRAPGEAAQMYVDLLASAPVAHSPAASRTPQTARAIAWSANATSERDGLLARRAPVSARGPPVCPAGRGRSRGGCTRISPRTASTSRAPRSWSPRRS